MENWLEPIRDWYNEETSKFDYKALKYEQFDAVLEIGVGNYEVGTGMIALSVMLKLIDPLTGQVLGRARAWEWPRTGTDGIFENDGQRFKDMISALGSKLITKCLADVGLTVE